MDIDIYDYVDRWRINYIVYHTGHLEKYGDVEKAYRLFDNKYQTAIGNMKVSAAEAQMNAIQANMRSGAGQAGILLKILRELQEGGLLQQTMDEIAEGLNSAMNEAQSAVNFDNYDSIAKSYSSLLSTNTKDTQRVDEFFSLLLQALEQAKLLNIETFEALSGISLSMGGQALTTNKVLPVTSDDAVASQKVVDSLRRAASKGIVNARSFATTISYIFQRVIGTQMQKVMLAEGLGMLVDKADEAVDKMVRDDAHLSWVSKGNKTKSGSEQFSTNLFNNGVFSLKVKKGKQVYDIEIGTESDIVLKKSVRQGDQIRAMGEARLVDYLGSAGEERYLGYNVIAHEHSSMTKQGIRGGVTQSMMGAYDRLRASVAASFFTDWLKNGGIKSGNKPVQFLIINGKVYSVMRIISNICNEMVRNNNVYHMVNTGFEMDMASVSNAWQGDYKPSLQYALIRSELVNSAINIITISASLNTNILKKYAY